MNISQGNSVQNLLIKKNLLWITLLTLAMGMLESSAVIYLRELYYPDGFKFPLHITSNTVAITELIRELATIVMLLVIGILAGKSNHERFAWFIYSFAIWDISYYLFLYLIIGWPLSLTDWDVLFLIPLIWVSPVWAPLFLSALMILLAICILYFSDQSHTAVIKMHEWILLIAGVLTVIIAFCKDYYLYISAHHPDIPATQLFVSKDAIAYASDYSPVRFDVKLFLFGCILIISGIGIYGLRNWKSFRNPGC